MTILENLFATAWVPAIGWTLLHVLWQATLVALLLKCLYLMMPEKAARSRYLLAMSSMGMLCLWAGITFYGQYQLAVTELEATEFPAHTHVLADVMPEAPPVDDSSQQAFPGLLNSFTAFVIPLLPLLVAGWLLGIALLGLRFAGGLLYLRDLRTRQIMAPDPYWQKRLNKLSKQLGIYKGVRLLESLQVGEPVTLGYVKPVILVPVGLLAGLTPEQVEAILVHELVHIRRADYLINLLQSLAEILFFFHPAVWWISARMKEEREHCCDDQALLLCSNRMLYAQTLIDLQQNNHLPKSRLVMSVTGNKTQFTRRIHRLFDPRREASPARKLMALLLLVFGLGSFSIYQLEAQTSTPVPKAPSPAIFPESAASVPRAPQADVLFEYPETVAEPTLFSAPEPEAAVSLYPFSEPSAEPAFEPESLVAPDPPSEPIEIKFTPDTRKESLKEMIHRLKNQGIELKLDKIVYENNRLVSIGGMVKTSNSMGNFNTDDLQLIQVLVYPEGDPQAGSIRVRINPGSSSFQLGESGTTGYRYTADSISYDSWNKVITAYGTGGNSSGVTILGGQASGSADQGIVVSGSGIVSGVGSEKATGLNQSNTFFEDTDNEPTVNGKYRYLFHSDDNSDGADGPDQANEFEFDDESNSQNIWEDENGTSANPYFSAKSKRSVLFGRVAPSKALTAYPNGIGSQKLKVYANSLTNRVEILFFMEENGAAKVSILNIKGDEIAVVAEDDMESGFHKYEWNPEEANDGAYLVRIRKGDYVVTEKVAFEQ